VIGNGDNSLYRFTSGGSPVWSFGTGGNVRSSPAVGPAGDLYFGSFDHNIYALHPDHSLFWSGTTGDIIDLASPTVGPDSTIYIGSQDRFLYAIRPNGSLRWTFTDNANIDATPCVRADGSIAAAMGSHVAAIDPATGTALWRFFAKNSIRSSPVATFDGAVYFGSDDSTFYCLNPNGTLRWSWPVGSSIRAAPAIGIDGKVYFGTWDGRLIALRESSTVAVSGPASSGRLWLEPPAPQPALASVTLRISAPAGTLASLEVFNVAGRRTRLLWKGVADSGERSIAWDLTDDAGRRVGPGVYRIRLAASGRSVTRSAVVLP